VLRPGAAGPWLFPLALLITGATVLKHRHFYSDPIFSYDHLNFET
jgi:hypothetical protein